MVMGKKWKSDYNPKCVELFEAIGFVANVCWVEYNEANRYDMHEGRDIHIVFLSRGLFM